MANQRIWFSGWKAQINPETLEALAIVEGWRKARIRPLHLVRAIRLYAGLLRGDTSILLEMFPLLALDTPRRASSKVATVTIEESQEAGTMADFLESMGMDDWGNQ